MKIYELTVEKPANPACRRRGGNQQRDGNNLPAGTNSTPAASAKSRQAPKRRLDAMLDETERILQDYILLLSSNQVLVAN